MSLNNKERQAAAAEIAENLRRAGIDEPRAAGHDRFAGWALYGGVLVVAQA